MSDQEKRDLTVMLRRFKRATIACDSRVPYLSMSPYRFGITSTSNLVGSFTICRQTPPTGVSRSKPNTLLSISSARQSLSLMPINNFGRVKMLIDSFVISQMPELEKSCSVYSFTFSWFLHIYYFVISWTWLICIKTTNHNPNPIPSLACLTLW